MNTYIIPLLLIPALCIGGCRPGAPEAAPEEHLKVKTVAVLLNETPSQSYVGTIEESVTIPLSFSVMGTIQKVYVAEGAYVQKGQLLAELSNSSLQNTYNMALSTQKRAEDAYNRLSEIYRKGSLPAIKFVEVETALEQSKAATQIALKSVNDCRLYAPASGLISKRSIEPGTNIIPTSSVLTLVQIDKVFVKTPVPEKEVGQIRQEQKATAQVLALDNKAFEGVVEEIGVVANPISHTYSVKIAVQNPDRLLKPGMVCRVTIEDMTPTRGVVIPIEAVQVDAQGLQSVFVKDASGKAAKRSITTGALHQLGVVVTEGLSEGEEIVVEGFQKLSNGMNIETVK
ncbi:MAG: efflux RND transporter periplasmic adaptor subunit [Bacteroidales bacterium]